MLKRNGVVCDSARELIRSAEWVDSLSYDYLSILNSVGQFYFIRIVLRRKQSKLELR